MRAAVTRSRSRPGALVTMGAMLFVLGGCRAPGPPATVGPPSAEAAAEVGTGGAPAALAPEVAGAPATVQRIVDGDTLVLRLGDRDDRVRLIGIDTPETKKPDSPVECFGPEAADRLASLAPPGAEVRLLRDVEERDDYDRLLAYLFLPDGDFVNLRMVAEGYATTLRIEPNVTFAPELGTAESAASRAGLGLWGACPAPKR
ncbi:MAG: thermonuclease [Acidimicrobiia bacterium]|nr:thermonuclease [Acidimicrobiia bacterium]